MIWRELRIKNIGRVITGTTPPTAEKKYFDGDYPFIKPSDLNKNERFPTYTEMTISEEGVNYFPKNLLPKHTPCVVTIGNIGKLCFTKRPSFTNQQINAIIPDQNLFDNHFVYYLMMMHIPSVKVLNGGSASGRENVNKSSFSNIKVRVPKLATQKKIASILSAYDDLIENNNQRITLLEEMAEEIYKEWFVRFRFPGFQNTNFVDKEGKVVPYGTKGAFPEGWEKKPVDEFTSLSKSASKLRKFHGEKRYLATADVTEIKITGDGEVIDWDNKPSRAQLKPEINSVFFARMSNTYKVLNFSEANKNLIKELALSSGFLGLKAKNKLCFPYLFTFIKGEAFHKYKDLYANGATQVSLTNEGLHMIRLYEPKLDLIEKFGEIVYPFYDEINTLIKKNQILQETRDLLLPRLISGKLPVEDLEVETLHMAAELETKS